MKFIFFADSHLRNSTPACRKDDDFYSVQLDKLQQVNQIVSDKSVDHVFHGGDLFDHHDPSLSLIHDVVRILRKSSARWTITPGNHDVFGESTETLRRSGLGILSASGVADVVDQPTVLQDDKTIIRFIPRTNNLDFRLFQFPSQYDDFVKIVIPHLMLVPKPVIYDHVLISALETNATIVCCSDYHQSFWEKSNETLFVNCGSTVRQSVNERNGTPQVLFVDTDTRRAEFVPLKFRPAKEVMELTVEPELEKNVSEEFLASLREATFEANDRSLLIREVGTKGNFSVGVIDETCKRVQAVTL